jgi:hypothetical protein
MIPVMLKFAVIGLMCNSLGCYWARDNDQVLFDDQQHCAQVAADRKVNSIAYFDTSCMIVEEKCVTCATASPH